jgi:hypothetical protein
MEKITDFLHLNFGLGKNSTAFSNFSPECLHPPFYSNKKGIINPENKYKNPTPYDFGHYKEITGLTTGAICKILGMDSRELSHFISQKNYEKGERIPSSMWCQLIEASNLSTRTILSPRLVDVRDEVLITSQTLPTKHELFLLINISDLSTEDLANKLSLDLSELKLNTFKGTIPYDVHMNYIESNVKGNLSKIHSDPISYTVDTWLKIREALGITGISFIKRPPSIRSSCLATDMSIYMPSPYKEKRKIIMSESTYISKKMQTENNNSKSIPSKDKDLPDFIVNDDEYYTPPTPKELRQIIYWTGYTFNELSMLLGIKPKDLGFLSSVQAYNHVTYRDKKTKKKTNKHNPNAKAGKPSTRYIPYYMWRRLIETFNLVEQKKIPVIND